MEKKGPSAYSSASRRAALGTASFYTNAPFRNWITRVRVYRATRGSQDAAHRLNEFLAISFRITGGIAQKVNYVVAPRPAE